MSDNVKGPHEDDQDDAAAVSADNFLPLSSEEMGVDDQLDEVDTISEEEQQKISAAEESPVEESPAVEAPEEEEETSFPLPPIAEPAPTIVIPPAEPSTLPYVPAESGDSLVADVDEAEDEPETEKVPRGTMDLGLFLLRAAVGIVFLLDGADKLFGLFGGSISQTEELLRSVGFTNSTQMWAIFTGVVELVAGIILVLGLFTPLAAGALLGVTGTLILTEIGIGIPAATGLHHSSIAFLAVLVCALSAIILTGAGRWAIDGAWKWATLPKWGSLVWWIAGIAAGPVFWALANTQGFPF
ncbi:MAG TPA: DoxX family protein [Corynebacteriales bacterium]|nr:DoxX family protein [Mycobacteriales bacterium]